MMAEWRPVVGDDRYEVSNLGGVRSLRWATPRAMRPTVNGAGYLVVRMGGRTVYVHRLVAEAFLGPAPDGCEVRHLNGNPSDPNVQNLSWGTHSENMLDRHRHGTDPYASRTHCPQDHPYDDENTRITYRRGRPRRTCRACVRADSARRTAARRELRAAGLTTDNAASAA